MLVIRPVHEGDLDDLVELAKLAGKGMTSMPQAPEAMRKKIQLSVDSFARQEKSLEDFFLLGLEDTKAKRIVGTASLYASNSSHQAFYAYRVMTLSHFSHTLEKDIRTELLHLTNDYSDCSEVGSLFLHPDYRGNGRWLAAARYLFMALFPERFATDVIAELRGWTDAQGNSPLWDAIGQHFFNMPFEEADRLCGLGSNQFITELMPKHPIYTCMLPPDARAIIGKPNNAGEGAMAMLKQEGFRYDNVVDIFDGGPILKAPIRDIESIKKAKTGQAKTGAVQDCPTEPYLVANQSFTDFRAIKAEASWQSESLLLASAELQALESHAVIATPLSRSSS